MPETDVSRRELERQILELKREKGRIEDNIRRMDNNQKRVEEAQRRERSPAKTAPAKEDGTPKRKRSRSGSEDSGKSHASKKQKNGEENGVERKEENKDEGRRKRDDKDTRPKATDKRSRAMFGGLLGHLKAAKSRLETEKGWQSMQKRQEALQRLDEKMVAQSATQLEKRKAMFAEQRKEEEAKSKEITQTIAEKEALLLQRRLESHYSLMMNFIRTKAEPTIFYLPGRGTKKTDALLEDTRSAIKNKIRTLKTQLKPMPEEEAADRANAAAAATEEAPAAEGEQPEKKDEKSDDEASIPEGAPKTAAEAADAEEGEEEKKEEETEEKKEEKADDSD
eukprot:TRINITY_DN23_c1_g1_i2.p1 TRINITY_DN23_c1_g1~~TRINITY_DN23_c1_g1_i2.p1  ORF type:complete len:369 (+),score=137.60 TRINITY_DN23_c1_g1_i2:95-1108(+)